MNESLIPGVAATPIPGPAWLFHVLLVFTFFLHALFMNLTLGGTLLAAIAQLTARGGDDPRVVLARRLMGINAYGISFAITTGIAPLLFVQLLYQQYFYAATILIAWVWLFMLVALMVGYYAVYVYKLKVVAAGRPGGGLWLTVSALTFLAIAMVHVAVNLIHSQPAKWASIAENPWSILGDPAYFPRLLHFVLAALGFSGLVVAWWAVRAARAGRDPELNAAVAGFAWKWVLVTTFVQVLDGFVLLLVLPRHVISGLVEGGAATLVPLGLAVVLGLGLLMMLARVATQPVEHPGVVHGMLAAMTLTIAVMSITRHQVRELYLAPVASQTTLATAPQWGNFVLFALLLVAGLATVAYMVRLTFTGRATGAEAA